MLLGSGAAMLMRVEPDADTGSMVTVAGAPYAAVWIVVAIARLMFTYESTHSISFGRALGTFLINNQISVTALADAIIFVGFAMMVANRAVLLIRSRRVGTREVGASSPATLAAAAVVAESATDSTMRPR